MSLAEYKRVKRHRTGAGVLLATAMSLMLAMSGLQAAKPTSPSCTITAPSDPISVNTDDSVDFQGVVSGGTAPYDVTWAFSG